MSRTLTNEEETYMKCMNIECLVRVMVLEGTTDNKLLVKAVEDMYPPQNNHEEEMFSEAIIYAKYGVLN